MGILRRFDEWAGLRLFHPPIIRFCRLTGYTQHRLHRDMWFAAMIYLTWDSSRDGDPWWWITVMLIACLVMGMRAALLPPHWPEARAGWLRIFLWATLLLSLPPVLMSGRMFDILDTLWMLTAEYAATITTIPPRKKHEKKARSAKVAA